MTEIPATTTYFHFPGPENTDRTLELAFNRARQLGISTVVVASTRGETGRMAAERKLDLDLLVVSHSTGFNAPDTQEMTPENRAAIETTGGRVLTCTHAFGGVGRAVRRKLDTFQLDEIIAHTLYIFGQGLKVVAEMAIMAADAGYLRTDTPAMIVAGTGEGADTAAVVLPTNAQSFFDLKIVEIVCRPAPEHPAFPGG